MGWTASPNVIIIPPDGLTPGGNAVYIGPLPPPLSDDGGILFYWNFPQYAFMINVETSGDVGQLHIAAIDALAGQFLRQFVDLEYDESTGESTAAFGATGGVGAGTDNDAFLGADRDVIIEAGNEVVVDAEEGMSLNGDFVTASQDGVNDAATTAGNDDTTSAVFVNLAGTGSVTSFSFVKRFDATRIKITMCASWFGVTATDVGSIGVLIDGTDYKVAHGAAINNEHQPVFGVEFISGVAAGTYTVQGRWRRDAGASVLRRNTDDWLTITAEEVN